MSTVSGLKLEERVRLLEAEVAYLKTQMASVAKPKKDWLDVVSGAFANDPAFKEAERYGREWRE